MRDPVPGIGNPIQRRALDEDVLEPGIEIDVTDCSRVAGLLVADANFFEEGRDDEVNVLYALSVETVYT